MASRKIVVSIVVTDVNEDPIMGVNVNINQQQAITDIDGHATITFRATPGTNVLEAYHADYVSESVIFSGDVISSTHNNPLLHRSTSSDAPSLFLILGRYSPSQLKYLDDAPGKEFEVQAKKRADIQAVVGGKTGNSSDSPLMYRNTHLFGHTITCAETNLTPEAPGSLDDKCGWQRIKSVDLPDIKPLENGRLFWLESKVSAASPKPWTALIWSPNFTADTAPKSIDMILFYTPSTDWVVAKYPYGVVWFKDDNKPKPEADQTYMSIGNKYIWEQQMMIYPLIARHRNAVLVIPMSNFGKWDPMLAQEGVWRLCKEVTLFLHRENRFSSLGVKVAQNTIMQPRIRAGASLRDYEFIAPRAMDFGHIPTIRELVVGFFSAGSNPAKWLMEPENWLLSSSLRNLQGKWTNKYGIWSNKDAFASFPGQLWGCSNSRETRYTERKDDFHRAWSEVWDMDGFHDSKWPLYLPLLDRWHKAQQGRVLRLCHSNGRRPRRILNPVKDPDDSSGLWARLKRQGITYSSLEELKKEKYTVKPIEEVHGTLWSVTALSSVYLNYRPKTVKTEEQKRLQKEENERFPSLVAVSDHDATFRIGWSHCIALSDVGT